MIAFGYRGYSKSPGHPSMAGLVRDADAIMEKVFSLNDKIDVEKVYIHGKSLGGGVASYLCSQERNHTRVRGIILDSTFNSMSELVQHYIAGFGEAF